MKYTIVIRNIDGTRTEKPVMRKSYAASYIRTYNLDAIVVLTSKWAKRK